jgi:hypothetical protein
MSGSPDARRVGLKPDLARISSSSIWEDTATPRQRLSISVFQPFVGFARFVHQLDAERKLIGPRSPLYRNALEPARPRAAGYVWGSPGSVEASRLRDTIVTGFHATNLRCLRSVGETYRRLCLLILLDCIRDRDIPPAQLGAGRRKTVSWKSGILACRPISAARTTRTCQEPFLPFPILTP